MFDVTSLIHTEWTCDVLLSRPGEFASPKWPGNYPSGSRCSWRITAPDDNRIRLHFTSFALESHTLGHCNERFDHVKILDGGTVSSPKIGLYCGKQTAFHVVSTSRDMFVQFYSDHDPENSRQGFHAMFEFEAHNRSLYDIGGLDGKYIEMEDAFREGETWEGEDGKKVALNAGTIV